MGRSAAISATAAPGTRRYFGVSKSGASIRARPTRRPRCSQRRVTSHADPGRRRCSAPQRARPGAEAWHSCPRHREAEGRGRRRTHQPAGRPQADPLAPFRLPHVVGLRRPRRPRHARTRPCLARGVRRCRGWSSPRRASAAPAQPSRRGRRRSAATRSSGEGRGTGTGRVDPRPWLVRRVQLARWPRARRWGVPPRP